MTTATDAISVDQVIAQPPHRVWQALTTPEQLVRWWAPGDITPNVGHRFHMGPGWRDDVLPRLAALLDPAA